MDAVEMFLLRHENCRKSFEEFRKLSEEQMRHRPHSAVNSIGWIIWHVARVEDAGVNRLVADRFQILDEGQWDERMRVPIRHHGTGMTTQEVTDFSNRVDIPSLWAYFDAVDRRTIEVAKMLRPQQLDEENDLTHLHRVLFDEGMLNPNINWKEPFPYQGHTKGVLLAHFGMTHRFHHLGEALTVRSLMDIPTHQR